MTLRQIVTKSGLSYTDILKSYGDKRMDKPTLSKILNGVVLPTPSLANLIRRMAEEQGNARKNENRTVATALKLILPLIGRGHKNATTRKQLCAATGLDDRTVRAYIKILRKAGHTILNLQDGLGYFIPTPEEEGLVIWYRNQENSRAEENQDNIAMCDAWLKRTGA